MAKDNILLITTDQQRFDTLNAWESEYLYTTSELYGGNGHQLQKLLCQLPDLRSVPYNHHDRTPGLRKRCGFQCNP